jgi:hypothetical protein
VFSIEPGPRFSSFSALIDHYQTSAKEIPCVLGSFVPRKD